MQKKYDLEDRLVEFASDTFTFLRKFKKDFATEYYGNQLLRSTASSALNFGEAQGAITKKDRIYKYSISLKELKESRVNLKIISKVNLGDGENRQDLLNEVEELIKIIATIIKNLKQPL